MTPEERAEKILCIVEGDVQHPLNAKREIAAQIREAVKEEIKVFMEQALEGKLDFTNDIRDALIKEQSAVGKLIAEAYEDAANIADTYYLWEDLSTDLSSSAQIANKIRVCAKELK